MCVRACVQTPAENVANMHKAQLLGWGVPERARYESMNSVVRVSGLRVVGPVIRSLGLRGSMLLAWGVYAMQTAFLGTATAAWQFYLVLPSFFLNILRSQALQTALVHEASSTAGFGQGELRGMMSNLSTVTSVISPLLWSNLYALGVRRGRGALFYHVVTACTLGQLGLALTLPRNLL
jgi:hypothetical protein